MTKTQELIEELSAVLDAATVSIDEKYKALGVARSRLSNASIDPSIQAWREKRLKHGLVGTGKKTEALRSDLAQKTRRR